MIRRSAQDIAIDLLDEADAKPERIAHMQYSAILIFACVLSACVALIQLFIVKAALPAIIIPTIMTVAFGVIVDGRVKEYRLKRTKDDLEYYIPIVMERLVMAVESGQDIIPAVKTVVELEDRAFHLNDGYQVDPVTLLLKRVVTLSERGMAFDEALKLTSSAEDVAPALKHAFVHLGIAFKEGGELVAPLRELSDATQLYYQETVEEEIAKLPVKATLPLVLTFAGLMTFFLASHLVQILSFTTKVAPK